MKKRHLLKQAPENKKHMQTHNKNNKPESAPFGLGPWSRSLTTQPMVPVSVILMILERDRFVVVLVRGIASASKRAEIIVMVAKVIQKY